MWLDYKFLKWEVRGKFKQELRDHEGKVVTNFKLHPKKLYKYMNEKFNVTSAIRAVKNSNNDNYWSKENLWTVSWVVFQDF